MLRTDWSLKSGPRLLHCLDWFKFADILVYDIVPPCGLRRMPGTSAKDVYIG
jgi:hypothetical protein